MADPTVKLVFAGNSAEAERVMTGLERKVDVLENKLKNMGGGLKTQSVDQFSAGLENVAVKVASIGAAFATLSSIVVGSSQKVTEFNSKVDEAWSRQREELSKWQTQEALSDKKIAAQMPAIQLSAMQTPVLNLAGTIDAQRQLASVGINEKDLKSGDALNALLRLRVLSQSYGDQAESPEVTATSINQFLRATGGGQGATDMERVGQKLAALSQDSPIGAQNLKQISQVAGTLTNFGLNETEQLAAYRVAMETQGDMAGSTGLKVMATRLATAGSDKERIKALSALGLKPEDVAVAKGGVGIGDAMARLRNATQGMDETKKNTALQSLFGTEAMATASILMSDTGFERYAAGLSIADNAPAEAGKRVAAFQNSREAIIRRSGLEGDISAYNEAQKGATWGEYKAARDEQYSSDMQKASPGLGRLGQGYMQFVESWADYLNERMGETPDSMMQRSVRLGGGDYQGNQLGDVAKRQEALMQQMAENLKRQTELMEQDRRKPINRNANAE